MTNKTRTFQSERLWPCESSSAPSIVCLLAVLFVWSTLVTHMASAEGLPQWRVLPIRSEDEYRRDEIGGEAEQHPHSIARCRNQPEVIYLSHDFL